MRIALITLGPLVHDSRVIRHARQLADAGHEVRVMAKAPLPAEKAPFTIETIGDIRSSFRYRAGLLLRHAPAQILPALAQPLYWLSQARWAARQALARFAPDLVIANDWPSLPLATFAKARFGTKLIYDSHEFAIGEFAESAVWRKLAQAHVAAVEERHIRQADAIMTVSGGLADALQGRYRLHVRPHVLHNRPGFGPVPFRATGDAIVVLYQGIISPRRGLEELIDSVPAWPDGMRLVLRGPETAGFCQHLKQRTAMASGRIRFEDPVPPSQTVTAASGADIGIFLLDHMAGQAAYVLPNKIFEYIEAGLAIVSIDLPEIRQVLGGDLGGVLLPDSASSSIARAMQRLTPTCIDELKRASLQSAGRTERQLIAVVNSVVAQQRA